MRIVFVVIIIAAAVAMFAVSGGETKAERHPSVATLARQEEPGERLVVRGQLFDANGVRPLAGVTIYAYHTAADGRYHLESERKPRLRAHVTTDADGRFELRTIRPGSYPSRRDPAHIHIQASGGGHPEQWLDDVHFSDDPKVTQEMLAESRTKGKFASIVTPVRDSNGVWKATVNVRLGDAATR